MTTVSNLRQTVSSRGLSSPRLPTLFRIYSDSDSSTYWTIAITQDTTARSLCETIATKTGEDEYFLLYAISKGRFGKRTEVPLGANEIMMDVDQRERKKDKNYRIIARTISARFRSETSHPAPSHTNSTRSLQTPQKYDSFRESSSLGTHQSYVSAFNLRSVYSREESPPSPSNNGTVVYSEQVVRKSSLSKSYGQDHSAAHKGSYAATQQEQELVDQTITTQTTITPNYTYTTTTTSTSTTTIHIAPTSTNDIVVVTTSPPPPPPPISPSPPSAPPPSVVLPSNPSIIPGIPGSISTNVSTISTTATSEATTVTSTPSNTSSPVAAFETSSLYSFTSTSTSTSTKIESPPSVVSSPMTPNQAGAPRARSSFIPFRGSKRRDSNTPNSPKSTSGSSSGGGMNSGGVMSGSDKEQLTMVKFYAGDIVGDCTSAPCWTLAISYNTNSREVCSTIEEHLALRYQSLRLVISVPLPGTGGGRIERQLGDQESVLTIREWALNFAALNQNFNGANQAAASLILGQSGIPGASPLRNTPMLEGPDEAMDALGQSLITTGGKPQNEGLVYFILREYSALLNLKEIPRRAVVPASARVIPSEWRRSTDAIKLARSTLSTLKLENGDGKDSWKRRSNPIFLGGNFVAPPPVSSYSSLASSLVSSPSVSQGGSPNTPSGFESVDSVSPSSMAEMYPEVAERASGYMNIIKWSEIDLRKKIGTGSFAKVYRAKYRGQNVAVKRLKGLGNLEAVESFRKEFESMSLAKSTHLVQFYGICLDNSLSMVMEFCERGSLYTALNNRKYDVDWRVAFKWIHQMLQGVHHLHSMVPQLVHRDLKSHNLLLDASWNVKVADFGLSRSMTLTNASSLGNLRGTMAYCLSAGTLVSLANGTSVPIETLARDRPEQVLVCDSRLGDNGQVIPGTTVAPFFFDQGVKECVELVLEDGSRLVATADHRVQTSRGTVPIGELVVGKDHVLASLQGPADTREDRPRWVLRLDVLGIVLRMTVPEERQRALAYARLFGYASADGSFREGHEARIHLGHELDVQSLTADYKLVVGDLGLPEVRLYKPYEHGNMNAFAIHLPTRFCEQMIAHGAVVGKKHSASVEIPGWLFNDEVPTSFLGEYLGGLFGKDGQEANWGKVRLFKSIMPHSTMFESNETELDRPVETCKGDMLRLAALLRDRFGIAKVKVQLTPCLGAKSTPGTWQVVLVISSRFTLRFAETIGFRHCVDNAARLSVAAAWYRGVSARRKQRQEIIDNAVRNHNAGKSWKDATDHAIEEFKGKNVILPGAAPSESTVRDISSHRHNNFDDSDRLYKTKAKFLATTGTSHMFPNNRAYGVTRGNGLPVWKLGVVGIRAVGPRPVFDISVQAPHLFVAQGMAVHNCAPEMYDGLLFSSKSDVYSIGVVMWELVTRVVTGEYHRPYENRPEITHDFQIIIRTAKEGMRPEIHPNTPPGFVELLNQCMVHDPDKRPTCQQILDNITALRVQYMANPAEWDGIRLFPVQSPLTPIPAFSSVNGTNGSGGGSNDNSLLFDNHRRSLSPSPSGTVLFPLSHSTSDSISRPHVPKVMQSPRVVGSSPLRTSIEISGGTVFSPYSLQASIPSPSQRRSSSCLSSPLDSTPSSSYSSGPNSNSGSSSNLRRATPPAASVSAGVSDGASVSSSTTNSRISNSNLRSPRGSSNSLLSSTPPRNAPSELSVAAGAEAPPASSSPPPPAPSEAPENETHPSLTRIPTPTSTYLPRCSSTPMPSLAGRVNIA